jgi:hypothetical protein
MLPKKRCLADFLASFSKLRFEIFQKFPFKAVLISHFRLPLTTLTCFILSGSIEFIKRIRFESIIYS